MGGMEIVSKKVLPAISVGIIVWLVTFLVGYKLPIPYVPLVVAYFALWIITFVLANARMPTLAFLTYILSCIITGILTSPLIEWMLGLPRITLVVARNIIIISLLSASIGVSLGAYFGWLKRDYVLSHTEILLFTIALCFCIIFVEIIVVILLGKEWVFLWTSVGVIIAMLIFSIIDGAELREIVEYDPELWMVAVIDFFLDFVNIVIRLIYILAKIYSEKD